MIVETIQRNVVESHDFKSEIATIDAEEMRYVSSLLRNNYSNTVLATVRETFANAVDANAGSNRPVKVTIPTRLDPNFRVRDFGRGLSEQDLFGLYTKYGRSTKRNDNNSIGGFGIGRFAPLSYTDSFTVTSIHEGQKTVISVYVDEFGDTRFTKLDSSASTEPSGIEISVAVKAEDIQNFLSSATYILRFASAAYETNFKIDPIKWKIKNENWGINSQQNPNGECLIVMGGIPYPIDIDTLRHHKIAETGVFKLFCNSYVHQNLVFFFPVGSVSLHHSRESLEYNQNTKNYIASALLRLESEVKEAIQKELSSISDSGDFFWKLRILTSGNDIGSICGNSVFIFTAKDGSKHNINGYNSVEETAAFQFSQRSKNVIRAKHRSYRSANPEPYKIAPSHFYCSSNFNYTNEQHSAILIDDGVRNISGRAEYLLINNRNISRVYVISQNDAEKHFLVKYNTRENVFWASKVTGISKQNKKQYGDVRLVWDEGYYLSSFSQKVPAPADVDFYYVKLQVESGSMRARYSARFGLLDKLYNAYCFGGIVESCKFLGITDIKKIYGVIDASNLPSNAIDLSALFVEKLNAEMERFKSFINRDSLISAHQGCLSSFHSYQQIVDALPTNHMISQYVSMGSHQKQDSNDKEALAYKKFFEKLNNYLPESGKLSEKEVKEIREKALTITTKYPMLALMLENRYHYNASHAVKKAYVEYINLVDKSY